MPVHRVLLAGPPGSGKTILALDYARLARQEGDLLSLDFERGQDEYHTSDPRLEDPEQGIYCYTRIVAPTLYEARAILAQLRSPTIPGPQLQIDGHPLDRARIGDDVRAVMKAINAGKRFAALLIDPLTRLGEDTTTEIFREREQRLGLERLEKLIAPTYGLARQEIERLLYECLELDLHLLCTAWVKPQPERMRSRATSELVPDVMHGLDYFFSLILLLLPAVERGVPQLPPDALILKSRLRRLRQGLVVPCVTWEKILASDPPLVTPPEPLALPAPSALPEPPSRPPEVATATPKVATATPKVATATPEAKLVDPTGSCVTAATVVSGAIGDPGDPDDPDDPGDPGDPGDARGADRRRKVEEAAARPRPVETRWKR